MSVTTVAGSFITDNTIDGTKIAMSSDARGDVLIYDGTNYVRLGADNGKFLRSNGTGSNPSWETAGGSNSFTNDVTVTSGNLVIATAGKGIDFSATANSSGSMSSELLDWYEEGTFTVAFTLGSGSVTSLHGSYTTCQYTRVGRLVTFGGRLLITGVSSPSGSVTMTGLPFTSSSGNSFSTNADVQLWGLTGTLSGTPTAYISQNSTAVNIYDKVWDSSEGTGDWGDHLDTDFWIIMSGSYIAA